MVLPTCSVSKLIIYDIQTYIHTYIPVGYRHVISSCGGVPAAGSSSQWSGEEGDEAEAWCKVLVASLHSASQEQIC